MRLTLLDIVQRCLTSIKGDEVNSISDTPEAAAIAEIVKECYYDIISNADLPENETLFELLASGDNEKPVLMTLPDDVIGLRWVKYDKQINGAETTDWQTLSWLNLEDFLNTTLVYTTGDTNVSSMTVTTGGVDDIDFYYRTDAGPCYYTSFDDGTIVFDAFDSNVDSTLQKEKTLCFGVKEPSWQSIDAFVPQLDSQQFNLLLQESKAMTWVELRQAENTKAERKARKAWILLEHKKHRANYNQKGYYHDLYPNYGRR